MIIASPIFYFYFRSMTFSIEAGFFSQKLALHEDHEKAYAYLFIVLMQQCFEDKAN